MKGGLVVFFFFNGGGGGCGVLSGEECIKNAISRLLRS